MKVYFYPVCLVLSTLIGLFFVIENDELSKELDKKDAIISQILNEDYVKIDGVHKRFHTCKVTDECCAN